MIIPLTTNRHTPQRDIAVLTYGSVYREVEAGTMTAAPLDPEISWTLCIAHNKDQRTARPIKVVIDIVRNEVHALVDQGKWRGTPQYLPEYEPV